MGLAVMVLTQLRARCIVVVLAILLHKQDGAAGRTMGVVEDAAYHSYHDRAAASIDCGQNHLVPTTVTGERPTDQWAQLLGRKTEQN